MDNKHYLQINHKKTQPFIHKQEMCVVLLLQEHSLVLWLLLKNQGLKIALYTADVPHSSLELLVAELKQVRLEGSVTEEL